MPLTSKDKQALYREFYLLINSGIDPSTVVDLMISSRTGDRLLRPLRYIRTALSSGFSFSESIQAAAAFSVYEVRNIQVGEETGRLASSFGELAKHFEERVKLRRTMTAALAYPSFVLFVTSGVVVFMLRVVVPMFRDVFARSGAELPSLTRMVVDASERSGPILIVLIIVMGLAVSLILLMRGKPMVQRSLSRAALLIPLFGPIYKRAQFARLYRAMATTLKAQLPLDRALDLSVELLDHYDLKSAVMEIKHQVLKGTSLQDACRSHKLFAPREVAMIAVAEEVRQLDGMFAQMAEEKASEVQYRTETMGSVLEPVLIVFIAVFVGTILIAMYLPMFKLSTAL